MIFLLGENMPYHEEVEKFRSSRNEFLLKSSESPIPSGVRESLTELPFFPVKEEFRINIEFVERSKEKDTDVVDMIGKTKTVSKVGKANFQAPGSLEKLSLEVYRDRENDFFFTIFGDLTNNSNETYGAGRYVKIEKKNEDYYFIDFNKAISPYCSYSEKYPCPLTPRKNRLTVRIDAGEKYIGEH
jgi:uncharacterized protein (DUF1684 family)